MQHHSRLALLVLANALIAACSEPPQAPSDRAGEISTETSADPAPEPSISSPQAADDTAVAVAMRFHCDDGSSFSLSITGRSALMELENSIHELRQEPAASGVFYGGDQWQLHSKDRVTLLIGSDSTRQCQRVDEDTLSSSGSTSDIL